MGWELVMLKRGGRELKERVGGGGRRSHIGNISKNILQVRDRGLFILSYKKNQKIKDIPSPAPWWSITHNQSNAANTSTYESFSRQSRWKQHWS